MLLVINWSLPQQEGKSKKLKGKKAPTLECRCGLVFSAAADFYLLPFYFCLGNYRAPNSSFRLSTLKWNWLSLSQLSRLRRSEALLTSDPLKFPLVIRADK